MAGQEAVLAGNSKDGLSPPFPPKMEARQYDSIGFGSTGIVKLLPCGEKVKKSPHPFAPSWVRNGQHKELRREFEIYQRLPPHPRLVCMLGFSDDSDQGLLFEYMPRGDLRQFLRSNVDITMERRLQWCAEASEAVTLLHSYNVIHADIRPDNMLLDQEFGLRLIDLCGSIDGKETLALESPRFFLPRNVKEYPYCNVTTDLFALGSSFYEIVTRKVPYANIESDEEVQSRYMRKEFPPVANLPLGDIMHGCWMGNFSSAAEVHTAVAKEMKKVQQAK